MDYDTKPSDLDYPTYMNEVEMTAIIALEVLDEYPEDYPTLHDAVSSSIGEDRLIVNYGFMLQTVYWSDQNPDAPDYCEPWTVYTDLTKDDLSWSDCVQQMAYVCFYSDVMDKAKRLEEEE